MREKYLRSCWLYAFLTVLCAASLAAPAAAQTCTVLHGGERCGRSLWYHGDCSDANFNIVFSEEEVTCA